MPASAWIAALRDQLLSTETTLRRALRRYQHDPRPPGVTDLRTPGAAAGGIVIAPHEARTLLRAAMPVPLATRSRREPHADLVATLHDFSVRLLDLNDHAAGPAAIDSALDLADTLRAWAERMRWHQATTAAGAAWRAVTVRAVLRQSTAAGPDQTANGPDLFDTPAAALAAEAPRARPRARPPAAPRQRSLLLPLPGATAAAPIAAPIDAPIGGEAATLEAGATTRRRAG